MLVAVAPGGYNEKSIFPDRPAVGWMIYLPVRCQRKSSAGSCTDHSGPGCYGKKRQSTLIITTIDTFDAGTLDHIKKANAIETRLVDQDLLPTRWEFVTRF